ncbi:MAG: tetraacyldisaccharide 4-kinase [Hyphomicrobiales bacterium]|jgi:tetraacyldisaccharide 4'-kinase|nr:tetraacyldisaccharide 4-kinase [Hyphomicrobiales bacterium]
MRAPAFWWEKPGAASALLSPLAAIYGAVAARRLAQPGTRAAVPVICVGNPTVGGAGKTPTAIAIARLLVAAGETPMFLTRGYGGRLAGPVMVDPAHTAIQVGDEPLLLARVAPTIVAEERVSGARLATDGGASVVVMDDGFQNPSLAKDFSILVVDTRGIGNGRVVPAGPLRAPLEPQLDRTSALLIVGETDPAIEASARARGLPVFHGKLEPAPDAVAALRARKVLAFAGIGDPEKFFATLAACSIDAAVRRSFPDHHRYSVKEARALLREADQGNLELLTTEKDAARLRGDASVTMLSARARTLPVEMKIAEADAFGRLVLSACAEPQASLRRPGA